MCIGIFFHLIIARNFYQIFEREPKFNETLELQFFNKEKE